MILDRWFVRRDDYLSLLKADDDEIARLNETINRMYGENDGLGEDLDDARSKQLTAEDKVRELKGLISEKLAAEADNTVSAEAHAKLLASRCVKCGVCHSIACPRVKRIRFRGDGQSP